MRFPLLDCNEVHTDNTEGYPERGGEGTRGRGLTRGSDLVSTMPGYVRPKVKDLGPFSASRD